MSSSVVQRGESCCGKTIQPKLCLHQPQAWRAALRCSSNMYACAFSLCLHTLVPCLSLLISFSFFSIFFLPCQPFLISFSTLLVKPAVCFYLISVFHFFSVIVLIFFYHTLSLSCWRFSNILCLSVSHWLTPYLVFISTHLFWHPSIPSTVGECVCSVKVVCCWCEIIDCNFLVSAAVIETAWPLSALLLFLLQ